MSVLRAALAALRGGCLSAPQLLPSSSSSVGCGRLSHPCIPRAAATRSVCDTLRMPGRDTYCLRPRSAPMRGCPSCPYRQQFATPCRCSRHRRLQRLRKQRYYDSMQSMCLYCTSFMSPSSMSINDSAMVRCSNLDKVMMLWTRFHPLHMPVAFRLGGAWAVHRRLQPPPPPTPAPAFPWRLQNSQRKNVTNVHQSDRPRFLLRRSGANQGAAT